MQNDPIARLRPLAGRQTLRLTHYGRKTGQPHQVTIWFALHGDKIYIGTAKVNRHWVRNVQNTPQVKLTIDGEQFEGAARFLSDPAESERARQLIARKYWMFSPVLMAGRALAAIGIIRDEAGFFEVTLKA